MAQLELIAPGRRFMGLFDGFPLPSDKAGMIRQITGYSYCGDFENLKKFNEEQPRLSPEASLSLSESSLTSSQQNGYQTISLSDYNHNIDEIANTKIEVHNVGLIPTSEWAPQSISLRDLQLNYFTKKNGSFRQFDIKLYNVLLITKYYPKTVDYIGVSWVNENTFKVIGNVFSAFFGQKAVFHKQGCLSRYQFEQVYKESEPSLVKNPELQDVDDENVRLYRDSLNRFSRDKKYHILA